VSRVSASIMHTDILSFHVDDENVKGDDEQCRGGVGALSQYLMPFRTRRRVETRGTINHVC